MMQQLLQAKPVGGGQQGEESGSPGRKAANNDRWCQGKRQEVAAGTGEGATAATAGGG